LQHLPPAST